MYSIYKFQWRSDQGRLLTKPGKYNVLQETASARKFGVSLANEMINSLHLACLGTISFSVHHFSISSRTHCKWLCSNRHILKLKILLIYINIKALTLTDKTWPLYPMYTVFISVILDIKQPSEFWRSFNSKNNLASQALYFRFPP